MRAAGGGQLLEVGAETLEALGFDSDEDVNMVSIFAGSAGPLIDSISCFSSLIRAKGQGDTIRIVVPTST